jgi:hypothetical protein
MRKLGWKRPLVKFPANYWKPLSFIAGAFPSKFRMDVEHLPAFDMGDEPTSAIHAVCSALDIGHNRTLSGDRYHPSYSFIRRSLFNEPTSVWGDNEHSITDVIRHIQKYGYVSESECPYEPGAETAPLNEDVVTAALSHLDSQFAAIALSNQVFRMALMEGHPIICGIVAYNRITNLQDMQDGWIRPGDPGEWPISGGAVCITGWDDDLQAWRIRTPFGALWGENGYGWLPYMYAINQSTSDDHYVFLGV